MSVILSSSRWKRKQRKRMKKISTLWRALPIMSEKCVPPNSQHFIICPLDMIFRKGTIYVYCTDWRDMIYCTHDWFCFLLQHPSDCIPPSTWVATLPPVRLLWAEDRGAAQATSPSSLRDRRQPRGCQSSDRRPPCGSGMALSSLPFASSFITGWFTSAQLLLGAY